MRLLRPAALLTVLLSAGLAFAQTPKKVLFDHTGYEDAGTSAYWIIDTHEPNPSPAAPTAETDWNGGISAWAFDLYQKGYVVQTLPASGGRITYNDASNAQDLKNYAVFVIPERYKHFTAAEMTAIVTYVQNGGGLYLMGNHIGATRATSIDPSSTDAYTVFNELLASNGGTSFGFTFVPGHGPGDVNANTVSNAVTAATGPIENAIVRGANGTLLSMDFHSYSYLNLTGTNANAKPILATQVSGDPATDYFVVAAAVGNGRVLAISDSAPSDDGTTTTAGKSLHNSYWLNSNRIFHMNTVDWLANGTATTPNTVTATISAPASNVTVASGTAVSFAGAATDSSASATLSYAWTFGDGTTATGASASHTFTNTGTTAQTFTVTFTATDNTGAAGSTTRTITVNPTSTPANTVTATITAPAGNVTIASGAAVNFAGSATDSSTSATLSYAWAFGDGTTAAGTSASHAFTNTGTTAKSYTVTFTATDNTGAKGTATRTVTVSPATTTGTQLVVNPGFESGATGWSGLTSNIGAWTGEAAHGGTMCAWMCGTGATTTETLYQEIAIPATATSATVSFWLHIDTAESGTTAYDTLLVRMLNTSGNVLQTLGTWSNANANTGYVQKTFDVTALKGQTVRIHFKGSEDSSLQTSFVIDDVTLTVK